MPEPITLGILVGGASSRMGGFPKGLLTAPGTEQTLVRVLAERFLEVAPGARVVLLGIHPAYAALGFPMLADDPSGVGPIGGLHALLRDCERRGHRAALSSCDTPFVGVGLWRRLLAAEPGAASVAFRCGDRLEPFPSLFEPGRALPVIERELHAGRHSLLGALRATGALALALELERHAELADWDSREDIARTGEPSAGSVEPDSPTE